MNPLTLYETWNVAPEDGAWVVRSEKPPVITSRHEAKEDALRLATRLALEERPSQVVVHSTRGDVTQCVIYDTEVDVPADHVGSDAEAPDPALDPDDQSRRMRA